VDIYLFIFDQLFFLKLMTASMEKLKINISNRPDAKELVEKHILLQGKISI
jgi:hypothetical protein